MKFSSKSNKNIIQKINKGITDFLTRPLIVIIVYIRSEKKHILRCKPNIEYSPE